MASYLGNSYPKFTFSELLRFKAKTKEVVYHHYTMIRQQEGQSFSKPLLVVIKRKGGHFFCYYCADLKLLCTS